MFNRKNRRGGSLISEINITSLTDICLVLLVILLMTSQFIQAEGLFSIQPPSAENSAQDNLVSSNEPVKIYIFENESVQINGQPIKYAEIEAYMRKLFKTDQENRTNVQIIADKSLRYEKIINTVDLISGIGYKNISLVILKKETNNEKAP